MANKKRDGGREAFWREVLRRQAPSGLSVRAFCQQQRLSEPSFYAWRRTIRERDAVSRQPATPAFLPVPVYETPAIPSSIVIELCSGRLVKLPASTSPAQLAEFVQALETRP